MLDAERLKAGLPIGRFGVPLYLYRTIGSTNDRAAELAAAGVPEGVLVLSSEQTAGRGRHGRSWDSPSGAGLAVSLVLRPPADRSRALGLVGGLAVVEAAMDLGLQASVKWPNDVLLAGRKVAGVLPEASWAGSELESVVLGIGVNLRPAPSVNRSGYEFPSTSLEEQLGGRIDPNQLVFGLLRGLEAWYGRYLEGTAHPAWEQHLAFLHELVTVQPDGGGAAAGPAAAPEGVPRERQPRPERVSGKARGLTPQGGLRLELPDGSRLELESGRLRPGGAESGLA